jgi:hypothetical protein
MEGLFPGVPILALTVTEHQLREKNELHQLRERKKLHKKNIVSLINIDLFLQFPL